MNNIIRKIKIGIYHFLNIRYMPFYVWNRIRKKVRQSSIVVVMQDMERMGSETLALYIIKELYKKEIPVTIVSYQLGPLVREFGRYSSIKICSCKAACKYIRKLSEKYQCKKAICNTVLTGNVIAAFKNNGFSVVSLVHEMKSVIQKNKLETVCDQIAMYADCVIFPSNYVYRDFCECLSGKNAFTYRIKNQGLFLTNSNIRSCQDYHQTAL